MTKDKPFKIKQVHWHRFISLCSSSLLLWLQSCFLLTDFSWGAISSSQKVNKNLPASNSPITQRSIPTLPIDAPNLEETSPSETPEELEIEPEPEPLFIPEGYSPPEFERFPTTQFNLYRLGIGDGVTVIVQRFPEFNAQSVIDTEGNIFLPLLGRVSVIGLTLEELETKISFELNRRFLTSVPEVSVQLAALRATQVTVAGEVFRPGFYPLPPGSTLAAALLSAGGGTTYADLRSIIVRRSLIDGTVIEQQVNLLEPLQNGTELPNLRLQDGDAVIVSRLEVGGDQDYDRILASRSTLAQQQIRVRVLSYAGGGVGTVPLPNGSTFLDALTAISPDLDNANLNDIALVRFDPEQGKAITQTLDGKDVLKGDVIQNVPLQDNDVIIVGRNLIARFSFALNRFTQPFRDLLGFLLFFDQLAQSSTGLFQFNQR